MRFRGTLVLLVLGAALGAYLYFVEIKGGAKREEAKQQENRVWKFESNTIRQIDLITPAQHVTAVRSGDKEWKLTAPRPLDADSEELNRMASSAADVSRESVVEANAGDLGRFGLNPPQLTLQLKTDAGKEYKIRFGNNNPTGNSTYAALEGKHEVMLVASYLASTFRKTVDELRNHSVLSFEQFEAQSLDLQSEKGPVQLMKESERWWLNGKEKLAADSSAVSGLLSTLAGARIKEFFEGSPDEYADLGFDKPTVDVRLTVGKDRAIKHLVVGREKAKLVRKGAKTPAAAPGKTEKATEKPPAGDAAAGLFIARDESRKELFFVEKDLVDKLLKSPSDLRDKALAAFQRWDIDSIALTNSKGTFAFTKSGTGGDWVLGAAKKKTKWDAVNGILDALEKPVKEFVDNPAAAPTYGLDAPAVRVVLKQGADVKVDCAFGKEAKDGVYARVKGESAVKIADKESLEKLNKTEADFVEPRRPRRLPESSKSRSKDSSGPTKNQAFFMTPGGPFGCPAAA